MGVVDAHDTNVAPPPMEGRFSANEVGLGDDPRRMRRSRAHRQSTPLAQALAAVGDRWTLLIALALANDTVRLSTLRERLPGVSSAVLDHHVRQMVTAGLLVRRRFREMPPRVELRLTDSGADLLPIARALARWGMRHRWSNEIGCEQIDAAAVLRQLPALLEEADLPSGTIDAILDGGETSRRYRFEIVDGRLDVPPPPAPGVELDAASTQIEGDRASWNVALGPQRDLGGLRFKGRQALARRLLESLPR